MRIPTQDVTDPIFYLKPPYPLLAVNTSTFFLSFAESLEWLARMVLLGLSIWLTIRSLRERRVRRERRPRRLPSSLPLFALLTISLAGCSSLIPSEHVEQAAVKTAGALATAQDDGYTRRVEGALQPVSIKSSGSSKVELHLEPTVQAIGATHSVQVDAKGKDSGFGMSSVKIPEGVKLLLLALGLGALLYIGRRILQSSSAANAGYQAADAIFAAKIKHLSEQASSETDPVRLAPVLNSLATAHADRAAVKATAG